MNSPTDLQAPLYLSPRQVEAMFGLSQKTLEAWRRLGKGPRFVRVSLRKVLYAIPEVESWLKGRTARSTAEADHLITEA